MSNIKAYAISPVGHGFSNDKWDFGIVQEIFDKYDIEVIQTTESVSAERAFVAIPSFEWSNKERELTELIRPIKRVVLIVTAGEANELKIDKIRHRNMEVWVQYPFRNNAHHNMLPTGAPSTLNKMNIAYPGKKLDDLFFAGQINHQRRKSLAEAIEKIPNASYHPTDGFAQGFEQSKYYDLMSKSKIVPAPAGVVSIDSFRVYEALELMCIPILDRVSSSGDDYGFWELLFDTCPLPQTADWSSLNSIKDELLKDYPNNMHQAVSWWIRTKHNIGKKMMEQINEY